MCFCLSFEILHRPRRRSLTTPTRFESSHVGLVADGKVLKSQRSFVGSLRHSEATDPDDPVEPGGTGFEVLRPKHLAVNCLAEGPLRIQRLHHFPHVLRHLAPRSRSTQ